MSSLQCRSSCLEDVVIAAAIRDRSKVESVSKEGLLRETLHSSLLLPISLSQPARPSIWQQAKAVCCLRTLQFWRSYTLHLLFALDLIYYIYLFYLKFFNP